MRGLSKVSNILEGVCVGGGAPGGEMEKQSAHARVCVRACVCVRERGGGYILQVGEVTYRCYINVHHWLWHQHQLWYRPRPPRIRRQRVRHEGRWRNLDINARHLAATTATSTTAAVHLFARFRGATIGADGALWRFPSRHMRKVCNVLSRRR